MNTIIEESIAHRLAHEVYDFLNITIFSYLYVTPVVQLTPLEGAPSTPLL